jgi:tetratricopeptide (TPR) repeat protein
LIIKEKYNLHKILIWLIMVVMTGPLAGQSSLPASVYRQVSRPLPSDISNPELEKLSEQLEKWIRQWKEQALPTDSTYGLLLQRKGVVASWLNEPREALKWFASAKSVFSNDGGDTQISSIPKTEYLMGESYLFSNDYPNALKVFKSILELPLGEASTSFWQVNSTLQIAYIYNAYGDFDKAIDILDKGLHLYCKPCNPDKAGRLYFEKAFSLRKLGRFQEAIGMLQMCLNQAKEARNYRESVRIHESLGSAYAVLNNVDSALVHFQNAMRISQQHHLTVPNNLYTNIGFMYHKNNDYDHAQSYYKKALANETDRYSKVRILTNLARVHTATGSHTESENHLMSALLLASPELKKPTKESLNAATVKLVPRKEYWLDWITSLADNYRASALGKGPEKLKLALSTYMLADTMTDYMRWEHTGEASKLFWRDRTRLLYENAIETCFLLNDPEQAFYFFEKSRAAILQDQLQELGAAQLLSVADQQKETELKSKIRQLQEKSINLPADSPELNTVRTSLFDTREALSAFVKGLEVSNPTDTVITSPQLTFCEKVYSCHHKVTSLILSGRVPVTACI